MRVVTSTAGGLAGLATVFRKLIQIVVNQRWLKGLNAVISGLKHVFLIGMEASQLLLSLEEINLHSYLMHWQEQHFLARPFWKAVAEIFNYLSLYLLNNLDLLDCDNFIYKPAIMCT